MDLLEKSEELRQLSRAVMEGSLPYEEYLRQRREFIDFATGEEGAKFDGFDFSPAGDMDDTDVNEKNNSDDTMPTVMRGKQEPGTVNAGNSLDEESTRIYSILIPLIVGGGATVILLLFVVLWLLLRQ